MRHETVKSYSLAICIRYWDVIYRKKLLNETGIKAKPVLSLADAHDNDVLLTVDQIFRYTPAADEIIESCIYRQDNLEIREVNSSPDCHSRFNVTKFFTLEFICYKFKEKRQERLNRVSVFESNHHTFKIFELSLIQKFAHVDLVNPIVWFNGSLPFLSRQFAKPVLLVKSSPTALPIVNKIIVSPVDTTVKLLESPYDTNCKWVHTSSFECKRQCALDAYLKIDLVPGYHLIDKPYRFIPVSNREYSNKTAYDILNKIYINCYRKCNYVDCHDTFTQTFVDVTKEHNKSFAVAALMSSQAETTTQAQPSMSLVDYVSFMCGCFGTWFGLYFLSLDPSKVWQKKKQRQFVVRFPSHTWICMSQQNRVRRE